MKKRVLAVLVALLLTMGEVGYISADTIISSSNSTETVSSSSVIIGSSSGNAIDDKNVKISKEEAKKIALSHIKTYCNLEIDEKKYRGTAQLSQSYEIEKAYTWQFNWSLSDSTMFTHISAEIDSSTGKLLSFNRSESFRSQEQVTVASITMEQASKLVDEFVQKINPDEYKQTKPEDNDREAINYSMARPNYSFTYVREISGLKYPSNYIRVGINGANGRISSYHFSWDYDVNFPSTENLIGEEKALKLFRERLDMDLLYIPIRNKAARYTSPAAVRLAYSPDMSNGMILDARTGDFIDYYGEKAEGLKTRDITKEQKSKLMAGKSQPLTRTTEMDSKTAETIINGLVKELFGAGYKAENLSYSESETGGLAMNRTAWNAEVMDDKPEAIEGKGTISIDSLTGEILNIGRYVNEDWYGKEYERKLTWEQAYDKAVEVLGRYYPYKLGDISTELVYQENLTPVNGKLVPDRMVYFGFRRLANGILYNNDSINITIDTKTGEICDLYYRWDKTLKFPAAEGVMDKGKAEDIFFKGQNIRPVYYKCMRKADDNKYAPDYKIVYILEGQQVNSSRNIDAFNGTLLDNYGEEVKTPQNSFGEAIKGHISEKELSILAFQGVIDTGSFEPDKETTYIELIKMLVNAKGYRTYGTRSTEELLFKNVDKNDKNYPYLLEAVRYGIIENKQIELKLDSKVTREQMVELIVKLLKYEKLAKAKDIFVLDFKDSDKISSELRGHVAIVKGLGIIDGSEEMFRPKENVKMHEAALIIYKALDSMREIK